MLKNYLKRIMMEAFFDYKKYEKSENIENSVQLEQAIDEGLSDIRSEIEHTNELIKENSEMLVEVKRKLENRGRPKK